MGGGNPIKKATNWGKKVAGQDNLDQARPYAGLAAAYFTAGLATPIFAGASGGIAGGGVKVAGVSAATGAGAAAGYEVGKTVDEKLNALPGMPVDDGTGGPDQTAPDAPEVLVRSARRRQQAAALGGAGRQGTILTGSLGLTGGQSGSGRTILGS